MGLFDRLAHRLRSDAGAGASADSGRSAEQLLELGLQLEVEGRVGEALQLYEAAVAQQPSLARAHFQRGNILLDRGDALGALGAYTLALRYKPDSAGTHCNVGAAQLQLSNPVAAAAAYSEALRLRPDLPDAQEGLQAAEAMAVELAEAAFQQGLKAQDQNQSEQAIAAYRQALAIKPAHVLACNNLGILLLRQGSAAEATTYFRRAADAAPDQAAVQLNLGDALRAQRLRKEALACYQQAVQLEPGGAPGHTRMGDVLRELRRRDEAAGSYRQALAVAPDNVDAHLGLAAVQIDAGQLDAAQEHSQRVLAIEPSSAGANNLLGLILRQHHQLPEAAQRFRQALAASPKFVEAHINLGAVLQQLGEFDAAHGCYDAALATQPDSAAAQCALGSLLQRQGRFAEAEARYLKALELDPELAIAHSNLGLIYTHSRQIRHAAACFQRAIELDPGFASAYANLAGMQKDLGRIDESLATLRRALEIDSACMIAHNNLLFIQNYLGEQSGEPLLADARRFGEAAAALAHAYTDWPNLPDAQRPLRVGLVSGDLGNHPVGYFLEGVLTALAARTGSGLAFYAYSQRLDEDETSQRLRACCKGWVQTIGLTDELLAQRIRADGIDILIDLAGHTAGNRLPVFAWRPAPVQISWLGYFATTGLAAMDYFLADPWTLPPDQEPFFTEQIWRLPETRLCFTPPNVAVDVGALPAQVNGYVTFGCFNNLSKMNDAVVNLWAQVLQAVPDSRLFLKYGQLAEASVRQHTCARFAVHGIDATRLVFEDYGPRADYLAAYQRVDIALDPFPFPGGTTTVEALWMGVPVLTLQGERFLARQGVGLLMNAGLPEWVATDAEDYVARAVAHARDLPALAALRARLRQQVLASPIYDAPRFAQHFEAALRSMWQRWCQDASTRTASHRE